jgi:CRISPR-associated protein Csa2
MVYISVRGRIWLQTEAANMVESIGNYVKHRKAPVLVKEKDSYITFFVPAISGESIAHTYQVILAEELKKKGINVCKYCEKGIFLKSANAEIYKEVTGKEPPKSSVAKENEQDDLSRIEEIEKSIIESCGVEDIGGFLFAEKGYPNVKRTSSFQTGYMIPVREVLGAVNIEPQLHSRYALGTKFVSVTIGAAGQMIYYVEVSSALFSFAFDLDTKYIGKYTFHVEKYGENVIKEEEIVKRAKSALEALKRLLLDFPVGAKRTRFNPSDLRWESIGIAVSDDVWTMPSSFTKDYLERAYAKKNKVSYNTVIHAYSEDKCVADKCYGTPEEAILGSVADAEGRIK